MPEHESREGEVELSVADRAVKAAWEFYGRQGWNVTDVSRVRGNHIGYDLLLVRGDDTLKVEVKGSAKPYYGIPDLHGNEVNASGQLVADLLFVVYFPDGLPERAAVLRREDIPPQHLKPKTGYCISNAVKGERNIKKHLIQLD